MLPLASLRWKIYALPTSFEILMKLKKHGKVPLFLRVENSKKGIAKIIEKVPKGD